MATLDISVARGAPPFDALAVYDAAIDAFLNVLTVIAQGRNSVTIGVAGPGLPQSGSPLSVSGPGVTVLRTDFRTTSNGLHAVLADVSVSPGAPTGMRNIIVSDGSQRTIITGAIELVAGSGGTPPVTTVNAASFTTSVAVESIAAAFGGSLAVASASATSIALPTSLGGTQDGKTSNTVTVSVK